jgi:hypothetical protein
MAGQPQIAVVDGPVYPPGSPLDQAAQQNGRCGACGKALLHPDSIAAGFCAPDRITYVWPSTNLTEEN